MAESITAQKKLREARFFLACLQDEENRTKGPNEEIFDYYLSAFLGAAYSVEEVLKFELRSGAVVSAWRGALKDKGDTFYEDMMTLRHSEIHREGARRARESKAVATGPADHPSVGWHLQPFAAARFYMNNAPWPVTPEEIAVTDKLGLPPGTRSWIYVDHHLLELKGQREDAIKVCSRFVTLLEDLLSKITVP